MNIEIDDIKHLFRKRPNDVSKGNFGIAGILGGSVNFSGAMKLANLGAVAMRSGAGIVRIIVDKDVAVGMMPYVLEQTLFVLDHNIDEAIKNLNVLGIGMGWGKNPKNLQILSYVLKNFNKKLLIDADGLNLLAQNMELLKNTKAKVILTPHLKEFSRLCNLSVEDINKDKINIAKNFASKYKIILLLKGSSTIITDGNKLYIIKKGSPGMATAGSGDVLSGILVGFLGYNDYSPLNVAACAYVAGLAGELAAKKYTDIAMIASDTVKFIPDAIKIIQNS